MPVAHSRSRSRYQAGSLERVPRATGPDVWVYRWREVDDEGRRVQKKRTIGTVAKFPTESKARQAVENLRSKINADKPTGVMTFDQLWGHFQKHELNAGVTERSPTTIAMYEHNLTRYILPKWRDVSIDQVKAVAIEGWLRTLRGTCGELLAPGTKMKLRNQLSCIYSHAIRHELFDKANPITPVRQGGKRLRKPDVLTLDEMKAIMSRIPSQLIRTAMLVAAVTGLRRSELRGLKWGDIDFDGLWIRVERGVVGSLHTNAKSEESRRGCPMLTELRDALLAWREQSLHRADSDWVFAGVSGKSPVWLCESLKTQIKPAVRAAGISKQVGWHTFRHSLATIIAGSGESMKTVQELLRHAQMSTTADLYAQGDADAKRAAQQKVAGLFLVAS